MIEIPQPNRDFAPRSPINEAQKKAYINRMELIRQKLEPNLADLLKMANIAEALVEKESVLKTNEGKVNKTIIVLESLPVSGNNLDFFMAFEDTPGDNWGHNPPEYIFKVYKGTTDYFFHLGKNAPDNFKITRNEDVLSNETRSPIAQEDIKLLADAMYLSIPRQSK